MGLYFTRETDKGATISVWEITESEEELLSMVSIPNDELQEICMTKSEMRRKERLAVRALLNTVFGDKVYLGHHDNGRPYLHNSLTEISIAHTCRFVCVITHPEESVGIDIESLSRDYSAVEKKALSEEEREELSTRNKNLHLACIWSAKETVFKRMSRTDVNFAQQIEIEKFNPKESGKMQAVFINKDRTEQEFDLNYEVFEDHIMVWVVG